MLEETIEESDGLIRTFDALLMIARAESGEVRDGMAEFDIADVARDVGELYEPLAEDKGLTLQIETNEHATVKGNRELVSQALANLVDNAIKYAAPDAKHANGERAGIVVETSADKDHIMLSVSDHGPGIPVRRPFPGGRAVRAPRAEPHRARLRPRPEPRLRGGAPARR